MKQHLVLTQQIIKKWQDGDDEEMVRIAEEEKPNVLKMFKNAVDEESMGIILIQERIYDRSE